MKTEYLKVDSYNPQQEIIDYLTKALRSGSLVVLPTETVYGIGFDPASARALDKIVLTKTNREGKPYSICVPEISWLDKYDITEISKANFSIIKDLLPGPITCIMEVRKQGLLGFRIPANTITKRVLSSFAKPLYLSSANASGELPARGVQEVIDALWGKVDIIVDGGCCQLCLPSLLLDLSRNPVKILRAGPPFVTLEAKKRFKI